jgi:metal-dependent amidase/aminoacylase/carboxypeptidase family protein
MGYLSADRMPAMTADAPPTHTLEPDALLAEADARLDDVVALRRDLHRRPELGLDLPLTQARVLEALDGLPLTARHAAGPRRARMDAPPRQRPVPVACEVVQALQTWVTRRVDVFTPAVITVARIRAGTTTNVIPETARIDGTIRTVTPRVRAEAQAAVCRIAEHVAAAHEMTAEAEIVDGYPVTVNDGTAADEVLATSRWLVGEPRSVAMPSPVMGAEDFSYILERVPGAMAFLGTLRHLSG